ncbi:MAG: hypothetical protein QM783_05590 [Phycisphaerales bacterium]
MNELFDLTVYRSELYVLSLSIESGSYYSTVMRFRNGAWEAIGPVNTTNGTIYGPARSMHVHTLPIPSPPNELQGEPGPRLVVSGGISGGVREWDGVTWRVLGGLAGDDFNQVTDTVEHEGIIWATVWHYNNGHAYTELRQWNGNDWSPSVASNVDGMTRKLCVFNNKIYTVGGRYVEPGTNDTIADGIAVFSTDRWQTVHGNPSLSVDLCRPIIRNGKMIVGGSSFSLPGIGGGVGAVGAFDGNEWTLLEGGNSAPIGFSGLWNIYAFLSLDDALVAAGDFRASPGSISRAAWATWHELQPPVVTSDPQSDAACVSGSAVLSVSANSSTPIGYRWEIKDGVFPGGWRTVNNGALVIDGQLWGALAGADTATLTASPNSSSLATLVLRAVLVNSCGQVTSLPASVFVSPADLGIQGGVPGHDGIYDNNDFIVFINSFFARKRCGSRTAGRSSWYRWGIRQQ